ncbi:MAG: CDP-glycerol glycerophosphotransferase family protein [Rickettsiales bacterium]|nr:CDP-glycerol glycerophosphotransferase family protein [Rickettsiales bacterium]
MRLAVILPYDMTARHLLETDFVSLLAQQSSVEQVHIVARAAPVLPANWQYAPLVRPFRSQPKTLWADSKLVLGHMLHQILICRFNLLREFQGFADRLKQSGALRKQEIKEGHPSSRLFAFPFPRSLKLYGWLLKSYWGQWQRHPAVEAWFDQAQPDLVVLGHIQNPFITPYILAARARGIPLMGMNGSWDQPTTKGPLAPCLSAILVQNEHIKDELMRYHGVNAEKIRVCGWPQMDHYARYIPSDRSAFLRSIGLPETARYILFGAYSERLGRHEPRVFDALARALQKDEFGEQVWLYVRAHPLDRQWQKRLGYLRGLPRVVLEPPNLGDLEHLTQLVQHASMVVASAGTILLDAAALDVPAIALAYEDETQPYYDRPARRLEMEHYAAVLATGGMWKVHNVAELKQAILGYLENPFYHASERQALRAQFLEPLDGGAAQRIVEQMVRGEV